MDPFDGPAFDHVSKFKCTVVGPRCLLTCLQKGQAVPNLPYPVIRQICELLFDSKQSNCNTGLPDNDVVILHTQHLAFVAHKI